MTPYFQRYTQQAPNLDLEQAHTCHFRYGVTLWAMAQPFSYTFNLSGTQNETKRSCLHMITNMIVTYRIFIWPHLQWYHSRLIAAVRLLLQQTNFRFCFVLFCFCYAQPIWVALRLLTGRFILVGTAMFGEIMEVGQYFHGKIGATFNLVTRVGLS